MAFRRQGNSAVSEARFRDSVGGTLPSEPALDLAFEFGELAQDVLEIKSSENGLLWLMLQQELERFSHQFLGLNLPGRALVVLLRFEPDAMRRFGPSLDHPDVKVAVSEFFHLDSRHFRPPRPRSL